MIKQFLIEKKSMQRAEKNIQFHYNRISALAPGLRPELRSYGRRAWERVENHNNKDDTAQFGRQLE